MYYMRPPLNKIQLLIPTLLVPYNIPFASLICFIYYKKRHSKQMVLAY